MSGDDMNTDSSDKSVEQRRRKQRNMSMALMIVAFVVIVYAVTILRLGASVSGGAS